MNTTTSSSYSSTDLELLSVKPNSQTYVSLKDLMIPTTAVNSPRPNSGPAQIRNRLVKKAAKAYLQPMSNSFCTAQNGSFFGRFVDFVRDMFVRAINWTLRVIRFQS